MHLDRILIGCQIIFCDFREHGKQILPVSFFQGSDRLKFIVGPDNPAVFICQCVRQGQPCKQLLLNPCIFRRKVYQTAQNSFFAVKKDPHGNAQITDREGDHDQTANVADTPGRDVGADHKHGKKQGPAQIPF